MAFRLFSVVIFISVMLNFIALPTKASDIDFNKNIYDAAVLCRGKLKALFPAEDASGHDKLDYASKYNNCRKTEAEKLNGNAENTRVPATKITGAFGIKFGEQTAFPKTGSVNLGSYDEGEVTTISPPTKNEMFNRYYVIRTPKTKKIYKIGAYKKLPKAEECFLQKQSLKNFITEKYGNGRDDSRWIFSFSNHEIQVGCRNGLSEIYITFKEKTLSKLADDEFKKLNSDGSGL